MGVAQGFPQDEGERAGVLVGMINSIRKRRTIAALALAFTAVPAAALAATDAVPGDPFKLGQDNHIVAATTTLSGTGQSVDAVLQVHKNSDSKFGAAL
jgi:hypothetical protein